MIRTFKNILNVWPIRKDEPYKSLGIRGIFSCTFSKHFVTHIYTKCHTYPKTAHLFKDGKFIQKQNIHPKIAH